MKRVIVFLALGPLSVAAIWLAYAARDGGVYSFDLFLTTALFIFAWVGSVPVALLDRYLIRALPAFPRALVAAGAGATIAGVPANFLISHFAGIAGWSPFATFFAFSGAVYAGSCSLLVNDWARQR